MTKTANRVSQHGADRIVTALEVAAERTLLRFAAEHMWRWLLLLALALHLCRTSALRIHTTATRRAAIGCACTIGTARRERRLPTIPFRSTLG